MGSQQSENQDAITGYAKEMKVGYWHHIPDAWLIYSLQEIDVIEWRKKIMVLCPGLTFYIFAFEKVEQWSGFAPPKSYDWIFRNFQTPPKSS